MSKVKVQGNPSGTGTLTIAAPDTNSDATINLPTVTGGEFIVSNASGNVGIGTSSPVGRFEIRSDANSAQQSYVRNVNAGSSAYSVLNIGNDSSETAFRMLVGSSTATAFGGANSANLVNSRNSPMTFWTNNTERARIAADGAQSSVIPGGSTLYPEFKCRAWVNFNGTGTVAIRASGNV